MPYNIINRKSGILILPDKRRLLPNSSLMVDNLSEGLLVMEQAKMITIHPCEYTICNADWCSYIIEAKSIAKHDILPGYGAKFSPKKKSSFDFNLQLPYNYQPHSSIIPILKWITVGNFKLGFVLWEIEYMAVSNGKVINNSIEIEIGVPIENSGPITTKFPVFDSEEFYENTFIQGNVSRVGNSLRDNFLGIVVPTFFELRYQLKTKVEKFFRNVI